MLLTRLHRTNTLKRPPFLSLTSFLNNNNTSHHKTFNNMTSLLYGSIDYWDNRYSSTNDNKEAFEWLLNYSDIRHLLSRKYCGNAVAQAKRCRVLIAGCGTSQVGEAMLSDGFQDITNIDFSSIVIDQMKEKYTNEWHTNLFANLRQRESLEKTIH